VFHTHYIECPAPSSAATEPSAWIFRRKGYREFAALMYEAESLWNAVHYAGIPDSDIPNVRLNLRVRRSYDRDIQAGRRARLPTALLRAAFCRPVLTELLRRVLKDRWIDTGSGFLPRCLPLKIDLRWNGEEKCGARARI
jgi:hypothetical protein